jgi:membrane protease YdiL (CAAX protease family)
MNKKAFKKTLDQTLRHYPIVIVVMIVCGVVLAQTMGDTLLVIGLVTMGGIVGPALQAFFYYQGQVKKEQQGDLSPVDDPAERLRQASQLFEDGLIHEDEYKNIREAVLAALKGAQKNDRGQTQSSPTQEETSVLRHVVEKKEKADTSMKIHPWLAIMVAFSWPMMGFLLSMVIETLFDVELSKIVSSIINLVVGAFGVFYLFPVLYRAPFGPVPLKEYLQRIGFYLPSGAWRHVLLGIVLAGCTLSGMLVASLLTGRYQVDLETIRLSQIIFSLNPGIFEEIFYRGIIVILLLSLTKSLKKAIIGQIIIFGLAHIKGFDFWALVDTISVMIIAIAFTYAAYKTQTLLAGMVFHFLHDSFLFFVQVPDGIYNGQQENILFYGILWLMVAVGCGIIWYAAKYLNVRGDKDLYDLSTV